MRLVSARLAGLLYLVIIVFGLFAEVAVRGRLTTADDILRSEGLYRAGIAVNLVFLLAETLLVVILYRLFEPVDRDVSLVAAIFRFAAVVVQAANLTTMFAALLAARGGDPGVPLLLDLFRYGYGIALAFFAVCCAATGYLLARTALGYMFAVAGVVYLANSFLLFLVPGYDASVTALLLAPAAVAEIWFTVLLLRRGDVPFTAGGTLSVHERGTAVGR
ncbi:DUF4386 domain-containing protein [Phytohabitans sp. LJ34]|uniref:DUF4386 domain-containing protein n=1 Tax=Phytohabitans sp. LJ34 TaxID=3452217 RepID=UPI003F8A3521